RIAADDRREGGGGLLREGRRDALLGQSRLRLACRGAVGGLAVRPGPGRLELDIASVEKGVLGLEKAAFRSDDDMHCELQRAAGHDASSKHGADPLVFSKTARDRHRLPADPLGAGRAGPWRAMARRWREARTGAGLRPGPAGAGGPPMGGGAAGRERAARTGASLRLGRARACGSTAGCASLRWGVSVLQRAAGAAAGADGGSPAGAAAGPSPSEASTTARLYPHSLLAHAIIGLARVPPMMRNGAAQLGHGSSIGFCQS